MSKRKKNELKATTPSDVFTIAVDHASSKDYSMYSLVRTIGRPGDWQYQQVLSQRKPFKELFAMHGGVRCLWRTNHMQVCGKVRNTLRSAQRHLAEHVRRLHGEETRTTK